MSDHVVFALPGLLGVSGGSSHILEAIGPPVIAQPTSPQQLWLEPPDALAASGSWEKWSCLQERPRVEAQRGHACWCEFVPEAPDPGSRGAGWIMWGKQEPRDRCLKLLGRHRKQQILDFLCLTMKVCLKRALVDGTGGQFGGMIHCLGDCRRQWLIGSSLDLPVTSYSQAFCVIEGNRTDDERGS